MGIWGVAVWAIRRIAILVCTLTGLWASPAAAHNLSYAVVNLSFPSERAVRIEIRSHTPALIMGAQQGALSDAMLPRFMAMSDDELLRREATATAVLLGALSLRADGRLIDQIAVVFPSPARLRDDAMTPRSSPKPSPPLVLTASLPSGTRQLDLALPSELGPAVIVIRYPDGRTATQAMPDGERTSPIWLSGPAPMRDALRASVEFVRSGFLHILPLGLDHILFIVVLAVGAPRLGTLVKLATVFTLAHSITLALGALRIVEAPTVVVEPAIALSIALVGLLTLLKPQASAGRERMVIIFAFGLLHGLGFAGALRETGLPRGLETAALAGFNVGVELGQLAVIALVLACVGWWRDQSFYRARIAVPLSAMVVVVGAFWTAQRIIEAVGPSRAVSF